MTATSSATTPGTRACYLPSFFDAGTLGLPLDNRNNSKPSNSQTCLELGAGNALPIIMAALLGVCSVMAADSPSPAILDTLRQNVAVNERADLFP
ncbi:hypothetical protein F4809DRAFT_638369 [Biscogniauxia mediterranea]|nr:hypothetical protein F4809DRAFT_638369 [Biscogniauxia mediterranea]